MAFFLKYSVLWINFSITVKLMTWVLAIFLYTMYANKKPHTTLCAPLGIVKRKRKNPSSGSKTLLWNWSNLALMGKQEAGMAFMNLMSKCYVTVELNYLQNGNHAKAFCAWCWRWWQHEIQMTNGRVNCARILFAYSFLWNNITIRKNIKILQNKV